MSELTFASHCEHEKYVTYFHTNSLKLDQRKEILLKNCHECSDAFLTTELGVRFWD